MKPFEIISEQEAYKRIHALEVKRNAYHAAWAIDSLSLTQTAAGISAQWRDMGQFRRTCLKGFALEGSKTAQAIATTAQASALSIEQRNTVWIGSADGQTVGMFFTAQEAQAWLSYWQGRKAQRS